MGRFLERYPGVQVVVLAAGHRDDVVSALRVGEAELGLIARPVTQASPADLAAPADLVLAAAEGSEVVVEIESREALVPLVLAGAGIAVVAEGFRGQAEASGLTVRDLDVPESPAVDLVHRRGPVSPAVQAFLDVAASRADS